MKQKLGNTPIRRRMTKKKKKRTRYVFFSREQIINKTAINCRRAAVMPPALALEVGDTTTTRRNTE